jgi:hypothetical protein
VARCDYGLSAEDILFASDKELNQKISMKQLAPYASANRLTANRLCNC